MNGNRRADRGIRRRGIGIGVGVCAILGLAFQALPAGAASPAGTVPPLMGTVVGEGGNSYALFGAGENFAWVKLGQEVEAGVRLIDVQSDRVTVVQEATGQETQVDLGSGGSFDGRASIPRPRPAPPPRPAAARKYTPSDLKAMSPQQLDLLNQEIKARFERARAKDAAQEDASQTRRTGRENRREED